MSKSGKERKARRKRMKDYKSYGDPNRPSFTGVMNGLWAYMNGGKHATRRYERRVRPMDRECHKEVDSF